MLAEFIERRYRLLLLGIVVFGVLLRVGAWFELRATDPGWTSPPLDSRVFLDWAREIADGDVLGDRVFFLNPLYPYFLAPIVTLFPADPLPVIRVVQGILGLLTILLVADATRRLLGRPHALGAALLASAYPLLLFYEQTLMIVPLAVFLNALTLWLLTRFADRPTLPAALLAGLPLGLSVLARPNVGLFALLLPLWLWRLAPTEGGRVKFVALRTGALVLGVAAVIFPVTIRNVTVGGEFVPVTSSMGINLWQTNNPQAWETNRMGSHEIRFNPNFVETDAIGIAARDRGRTLLASEVSSWWQRKTLDTMAESPGRAAGFLARKLVFFLGPTEPPSSYHFEMQRDETTLLRLLPLGFWLLGPLALVGTVLVILRRRGALPFALLFIAYAIGLTIFFPLAHYRAPVLPAVFPLATVAFGAIAGRRGRALILPIVLLLVSAALANLARPGYDEERVTWWYNRGVMLLSHGEQEAAEEAFRAAQREGPDSRLPDLGLAAAARARQDLESEAVHLENALSKAPGDPGTLGDLGYNRFRSGHREKGLRMIRRALEVDPRDPNLHRVHAAILMELGRFDLAIPELEAEERLARSDPVNLANRAVCFRLLKKPREALGVADRGVRLFPAYPGLHFERAYALLMTGAAHEQVRAAVLAGREAGGRIPPDLASFAR